MRLRLCLGVLGDSVIFPIHPGPWSPEKKSAASCRALRSYVAPSASDSHQMNLEPISQEFEFGGERRLMKKKCLV